MNNTLTPHIICGKCGNRHATAFAVKICYGLVEHKQCMATMPHDAHQVPATNSWCRGLKREPAPVEQKPLPGVTGPQLDYIARLGGDVEKAKTYTMKGASLYIDRLKKNGPEVTTQPAAPAWEPPPFKVPLGMLHEVPDGYYAVQPDQDTPLTFFRISRPKSGKYKGSLKIQTQHGPDFTLRYAIFNHDKLYRYGHTAKVEDDLLLLVVDPHGAAIAYADKIGRCMRCNLELTDERSRWYGIGPECEKHWTWVVPEQDDRKGPFRFGQI